MSKRNGHFPCQPAAHKHDQAMTVAIGLHSIDQRRPGAHHALLIIPALVTLVSCRQPPSRPARSQAVADKRSATSPSPTPKGPPIKSDRVITIHAIDNQYQGSTAILPDNRLDHQKGSHD